MAFGLRPLLKHAQTLREKQYQSSHLPKPADAADEDCCWLSQRSTADVGYFGGARRTNANFLKNFVGNKRRAGFQSVGQANRGGLPRRTVYGLDNETRLFDLDAAVMGVGG